MWILAADIGGTKTLLQITEISATGASTIHERRYPSEEYADPLPIFLDFLQDQGPIDAACLGVAGPVQSGPSKDVARVTNLPWRLDSAALAEALRIPRVRLINDFQAVGYAIDALTEKDLVVLQAGEERRHGVRAVIGAGTGLGEGYLVWQTDHYEVMASEGGHVEFAPQDDLQAGLLDYLRGLYGHVSYERVLSGPGLVSIYDFLRTRNPEAESPELKQAMGSDDPAAAISEFAWRKDDLAQQALTMFVNIYGAQAGNLALTLLAHGGVYVAGGIAPKIIDFLDSGHFLNAFNGKGRMEPLMRKMPVKVILNPHAGLIGATVAAGRL